MSLDCDYLSPFTTGVSTEPIRKISYYDWSYFYSCTERFCCLLFFASSLVGQRQQLSSLQAFGTDGELALENALMATFPNAQHVRCFLHFKGNIEQKFWELNIPSSEAANVVLLMQNPLRR